MYRDRPKSPSFTHSAEATRMFRTAMSLEQGYEDKVVQNAPGRQTDRQTQMNGETKDSAGQRAQ